MEPWLMAQKAEIDAINAEIQGMIAENQYCIVMDETLKYGEKDFEVKAMLLRGIANMIVINS